LQTGSQPVAEPDQVMILVVNSTLLKGLVM
jgi:hypothetical protein